MTATDAHRGFMEAICADPADDTVRLVYADVLDDCGQSDRAALIRTQVELARIGPEPKQVSGTVRALKTGDIRLDADAAHLPTISVGDRVDVKAWAPRSGLRTERLHGLLVAEKIPRETCGFLLRRDEMSGPYPKERADELLRREDELIRSHARRWLRDTLPAGVYQDYDRWEHKGGLIRSKRDDTQHVVFRRGFVAEVRCTTAAWVGERCYACMEPNEDVSDRRCRLCRGSGRVNAHGPALVRAAPLTRVVLSDREPYYQPPPDAQGLPPPAEWDAVWPRHASPENRWFVPPEIRRHMARRHFPFREFNDAVTPKDAALSALSDACILLAKNTPACQQ